MIRLSDLRRTIGGKPSSELDDELASLRDVVVDQFERATGLLWKRREDFRQAFCNFGRPGIDGQTAATTIWLPLRPVDEVTLVELRTLGTSGEYTEQATSVWALDDYRLDRIDGLTWCGYVRVTYTGGYDDESCPSDIRRALLTQAAFVHTRTANDKLVVTSHGTRGNAGSAVYEKADYCPLFSATVAARKRTA